MSRDEVVSNTKFFRRQALNVTVIRACRNCGAPGFWHDDPTLHPGCFNPELARQAAMVGRKAPVGNTCPQCGSPREELEDHGTVWSREWRNMTLAERLRSFFRRSK